METPVSSPPRRFSLVKWIIWFMVGIVLLLGCCTLLLWVRLNDVRTQREAAALLPQPTRRPTFTPYPTSTATPLPSPTPVPVVPSIGETVEAGGVSLVVHSITAAASHPPFFPNSDHFYLIADATITNVSRDEAAYSPLYFSIKDADGFEYPATFIYVDPALHAGTMPLGDKVRGNVTFEIPLSATNLILIYDPIVIRGGYGQIRIDLGVPPHP